MWHPRLAVLILCVAACGGGAPPPPPGPLVAPALLPPPRPLEGPLDLRIAYPPASRVDPPIAGTIVYRADSTYLMPRTDSVFVFGSIGRGDAMVFVNGYPVEVYPTGGWIAWLPLTVGTTDSVVRFDFFARADDRSVRAELVARLSPTFDPGWRATWIDTTSFRPTGQLWLRPDEGVPLAVRASPGAQLRIVLPDGHSVPLLADSTPAPLAWGERAFRTDLPPARPPRADRYAAWWTGRLGAEPGTMFGSGAAMADSGSAWAIVEAIRDIDTVRARWPLQIGIVDPQRPVVVRVDDDPQGLGGTDSSLAGRPNPYGTYHWFFPTGTVAVASGRWNDQVRLQLSRTSVAWVDARDVHPLPAGTPPPGGAARSMRLMPGPRVSVLRIPLPARIPYRIAETERQIVLTLYGTTTDMDWVQYGGTDSFVELVEFHQPTEDEATITVTLAERVWGYRTRWAGEDLLLEIRRPPPIDPAHPLRDVTIVLDPGHPPGGATGPTGLREPDAMLEVARKAKHLLDSLGARVVLTRADDVSVSLVERLQIAERVDGEVLVSVHANALPDGMNPFVNNGTSVYFFHPRSAPLARAINRALVRQFGFRDLGVGRGDLALARPTWMPAVLTEGLFMMLPDQEAVLASEAGQWRYAAGLVEGIRAFLATRAQGSLDARER